ncbi:MAG: sulfite oxidase-like oxidoreductase [Dehalococcoidia bacterium]|nr:sulfite oxidase-like oxidoreductase [Dehalococcoidia bacterium]MEE2926688.1 sulfite oxidase-like oxidoreductase [Chloroflexota bacterium]
MKRPDQLKDAPDQGMGDRVPPGQFLSNKFPVLTYGSTPKVDLDTWKFRVFGLVEQEVELTWDQFTKLTWTTVTADFHCVTQWSSLDNTWEGVTFPDLMALAQPKPEAKFVMAHCFGGYTTNLPLEVAMEEGLLVHKQDGEPLGEGHGWPLRLIIPSRYGWKSAKWLNGIELIAEDAPGFWEQRGYNNNADPWKEERFWPELTH